MLEHQQKFIAFAIAQGVLKFGDFTLKSGRKSPYFFNMGEIKTGAGLAALGQFYANSIAQSYDLCEYDILFGPAYKGITLAASASIALARDFEIDKGYTYNRKEAKDHGEGGVLVGANIQGKKVVLVDDVITSGKTITEAKSLIEAAGGILVGVAIALDRQEQSLDQTGSAVALIKKDHGIKVSCIISLAEIIEYIESLPTGDPLKNNLLLIKKYRETYGVVEEFSSSTE